MKIAITIIMLIFFVSCRSTTKKENAIVLRSDSAKTILIKNNYSVEDTLGIYDQWKLVRVQPGFEQEVEKDINFINLTPNSLVIEFLDKRKEKYNAEISTGNELEAIGDFLLQSDFQDFHSFELKQDTLIIYGSSEDDLSYFFVKQK